MAPISHREMISFSLFFFVVSMRGRSVSQLFFFQFFFRRKAYRRSPSAGSPGCGNRSRSRADQDGPLLSRPLQALACVNKGGRVCQLTAPKQTKKTKKKRKPKTNREKGSTEPFECFSSFFFLHRTFAFDSNDPIRFAPTRRSLCHSLFY